MPAERYYLASELNRQQLVQIEGQEFHHLVHVMRTKVGEQIEIINGQGLLASATLNSIEKKRATAQIDKVLAEQAPKYALILAQAIPRLSKLEIILEKSTELGMTEIWLFPAERSEKNSFSTNQLGRLETILIASIKQCGRLFLPTIRFTPPIKQWEELPQKAFFGDVRPSAPLLFSFYQKTSRIQNAFICIGPESGLSEAEICFLEKLKATGVKLNENILRTETAAIASLSLLSHWLLASE